MKKNKNWFLVTLFFLAVSSVFAQGKITGLVFDENGPLPGANVVIEGTSVGTSTGFDGAFSMNSPSANGEIVISFLGFATKKVAFSATSATTDLGTIILKSEDNLLGEVVIRSSVIDVAKDRKTPVAVSTIKASEIKEKLGSQEFPEILVNTPSVYATKGGGGFGDSRINIRGFDQRNVAVMINGVPVNDMENGAVFWSNWAGLSDVTSAMQVQRGLGSSKLAISSVGGTINIVTRTADIKQGGSVSATMGNDEYIKTLASYSTGKMKNGLSASVLFSNTEGAGYVNGTKFQGQNYFIGLGYEINDKHDLQFTFAGAPQWHNQRSTAPTLNQYIKYGGGQNPNIRYNSDWGQLNGEEYSFRTNYYHKPVASLNYNWNINERTKISTVLYGSWGRGGGSNGAGAIRGNRFFSDNLRGPSGIIDLNLIQAWNSGQTVNIPGSGVSTRVPVGGFYQNSASTSNNLTNGISKISSVNSHDWYGGIINVNKKLSDKLVLDFGLDARTYHGFHYQNLNDLLGADNYNADYLATGAGSNDINNPVRTLTNTYNTRPNWNPFANLSGQEKINFNNDGLVRWYGLFTQLEYSTEKLTTFIQGAVSQQGFKRVDYFKYTTADPLSSTDFEKIIGGNIKGGANYNLTDKMNVFFNAGYYSKQPFFNAVYPNNASVVKTNLTNEKIVGVEAGYGFKSSFFNANLNVYYTNWKDRYLRNSDTSSSNPGGYFEFNGVNETHSGIELELNAKPINKLGVNAMFSLGNWEYSGNAESSNYDATNNLLSTAPIYLKNVKVGDVAQMTASLGANYEVAKNLKVDANYRVSDKLYASIDPTKFSKEDNKGTLELPNFGLLDAGVSFKINRVKDSKDFFNLRVNVNNVLNEIYISESKTNQFAASQAEFDGGTGDGLINPAGSLTAPNNKLKGTGAGQYPTYQDYQSKGIYEGVDNRNGVFFGFGRTWNFTFAYNF